MSRSLCVKAALLTSFLGACSSDHPHEPALDAGQEPSVADNEDAGESVFMRGEGGIVPDFEGEFPLDPSDASTEDSAEPYDDATTAAPDAGGAFDAGSEAMDAGNESADSTIDGSCDQTSAGRDVDLLLMIDNSGSMSEEQARLTEKLSRLLAALTSGDKEAASSAPRTDEYAGRRFAPPRSLHIGIVTSTLGAPPTVVNSASPTCQPDNGGAAGNGLLQYSGAIAAVDQVNPNTAVVVRPGVPACGSVSLSPHYLEFGTAPTEVDPHDTTALQNALFQFGCVAQVGVTGCGIEQPLESIWKALAPRTETDFVGPDMQGQGDRGNAGFMRSDSLLVVLAVSDEDDCSVTSEGALMFERSTPATVPPVQVRCQLLRDDPAYAAMVPRAARYVNGLLSLRATHPERVLFAGIVGLPQSLVDYTAHDTLLADPRMQMRLLNDPSIVDLEAVCGSDVGSGKAYPGRRFVEVAKGIAAAGGHTVLRSICDDDYGPIVDGIVERIATQLAECPPEG